MPTVLKNNDINRPCPICEHSLAAELLHTQPFALADNHILPSKYDVIACGNCGFVYADTPANQDLYDEYYAEMSKYDMHSSSENSLYIDRSAWIETFVRDRTDSIIDIGCGNGQLLLELQRIGMTDLTGLDPSEKCISDLNRRGIKGIKGSIFSVSTDRRYDCAILSGVLEHIYDVRRLMETMKVVLTDLGLLFVCVPDASRYHDFDSVSFDYFNIEHINHFDETSLLNLGMMHGFSTIGLLKTTIKFFESTQPVIFCVYQNKKAPPANWLSYSRNCVVDYISHTQEHTSIKQVIARLAESGEEIIIWGAGYYTSRLLAGFGLAKCNIVMIVDNDRHKQGAKLCGTLICHPSAVRAIDKKCTIVIAAAVLGDEIVAEIRRMGLDHNIIPLGKMNGQFE